MLRIIRAPIFFIAVALSFIPTLYILGIVTVGSWLEDGLRRLGIVPRQEWILLVLGIVSYTGLGIVVPVYLGVRLFGLPGAIVGPIFALLIIGILGRW